METAIQIQNVWKIFGNNSKEALDAIQNQKISKQQALEKYILKNYSGEALLFDPITFNNQTKNYPTKYS